MAFVNMNRNVKIIALRKAVAFTLFLLGFTFLISQPVQAQFQKHANIWYFGNGAGLDFNNGTLTVLTNGAMDAFEGTATIADAQGNLLFYSDGKTVWNKQHQVMSLGTGLMGSDNSAQSCLIVQNPGKPHIYYIFTTDAIGNPNDLRYSTIDMSRADGLGQVTEKNTLLYTPTSEKLTAVLHKNKRDAWVVSHQHGTNTFRSFLVTAEGVNLTSN